MTKKVNVSSLGILTILRNVLCCVEWWVSGADRGCPASPPGLPGVPLPLSQQEPELCVAHRFGMPGKPGGDERERFTFGRAGEDHGLCTGSTRWQVEDASKVELAANPKNVGLAAAFNRVVEKRADVVELHLGKIVQVPVQPERGIL